MYCNVSDVIMLLYISLPNWSNISTLYTTVDRERFSVFRVDHWAQKSNHLRSSALCSHSNFHSQTQTCSSVHLNLQVLGHYLQNVLARDHSRDHPDKITLMVVIIVIREKTGTTFNKAVSLVKTHDNSRYTLILILRPRSFLREHGQWPVAWWRQRSVERRPPEMDTYHLPYKKVGTPTGRIIICHQQHNKLSDMTPEARAQYPHAIRITLNMPQ